MEDGSHMSTMMREWNDQKFEDKECSLEEPRSLFFNTLFLWAIAIDFSGLNFDGFLVSISRS